MKPIEIKKALNIAQTELKTCYLALGIKNNDVINVLKDYSEAMSKSIVMGGGYCKKQNTDNSGACFFQCEECKMRSWLHKQKVTRLAPATLTGIRIHYLTYVLN
jgi:hypothetical protein